MVVQSRMELSARLLAPFGQDWKPPKETLSAIARLEMVLAEFKKWNILNVAHYGITHHLHADVVFAISCIIQVVIVNDELSL